jgi:hypothetical protein
MPGLEASKSAIAPSRCAGTFANSANPPISIRRHTVQPLVAPREWKKKAHIIDWDKFLPRFGLFRAQEQVSRAKHGLPTR